MAAPELDLVVVGAGIHGVGIAQAAAAAGHRVLLLEARAPAAGTSSRSSKLVHGGLRYLETFQLRLVRESLRERAVLLRLAPELVRLVPFFVPVWRDTSRPPWKIRAGLSLYALLGGLAADARFSAVPRARWDELDGLRTDGLRAVFRYHDGQTDDAALVRAVLRSAVELGARLECPAELVAAHREGGGWRLVRRVEGAERASTCRVLVNAAGPWVERVRERLHPAPPGAAVELVGGTHVELEGELTRGIYYSEAPSDRRAVFAIPWKGRILVGTTERPWRGDPADVAPSAEEITYLEACFRHAFPDRPVARLDAWAGLRVLPRGAGAAFRRPREVLLVADAERAPTTLGVYGGKLTGYRLTAEKVLDRLRASLPARPPLARTDELPLSPDPAA